MMTQRSVLKQSGQGLIEILIVCVLVTIACLSLMKFQAALSYKDSLALQRSDATILALNQLEELRDYQVLTTQTPYTAYSDIASGSATSTGVNTTYTITWTVTTVASPSYKVLNVAVTWQDKLNTTQTVTLTTNVAGGQPVFSATVLY
jgi:Tfp pilus assembly protein PilV